MLLIGVVKLLIQKVTTTRNVSQPNQKQARKPAMSNDLKARIDGIKPELEQVRIWLEATKQEEDAGTVSLAIKLLLEARDAIPEEGSVTMPRSVYKLLTKPEADRGSE